MGKYVLIALLHLLYMPLAAQVLQKDNQCAGINQFILGEPKSKFADHISYAAKYTKDGHEFIIYNYSPPPGQPISLTGVLFNTTMVIFNDKDELVSITIIKFYKVTDTDHPVKDAKKDFKKMIASVKAQMNEEGDPKTYMKTKVVEKGQEWRGATNLLKLTVKNSQTHASITVSLELL